MFRGFIPIVLSWRWGYNIWSQPHYIGGVVIFIIMNIQAPKTANPYLIILSIGLFIIIGGIISPIYIGHLFSLYVTLVIELLGTGIFLFGLTLLFKQQLLKDKKVEEEITNIRLKNKELAVKMANYYKGCTATTECEIPDKILEAEINDKLIKN